MVSNSSVRVHFCRKQLVSKVVRQVAPRGVELQFALRYFSHHADDDAEHFGVFDVNRLHG
jgi:hypothetical protein